MNSSGRSTDVLPRVRARICDLSDDLHSVLWPDLPRMSICAHAHFREDCPGWRIYARVVDWLWRHVLRGEEDHCREAYRRRWP